MKHEGAAFWGLGGGHDSPSFFSFVHFEDTTFQPEFIFIVIDSLPDVFFLGRGTTIQYD